MKIKLPNIGGQERNIEDRQSIVLIGANGSGKTRMSIWINSNNMGMPIHRISAQKSLNMPEMVSPTELDIAEEKFLYGDTNPNKEWLKKEGKNSRRWQQKPATHLLNDFSSLMELLVTENYEKSLEYRESHKSGNVQFDNETRLEKIKSIWENVIIHRKLKICAGKIEVSDIDTDVSNTYYNGSDMSDGERAIFYFIGEALSVPSDSLIIIDEPENHLHKSILVRLWNAIEAARRDCTFLYITHSLKFASSRMNSQIIWVKEMVSNSEWDYEFIDDIRASDNLLLEILGNRQKVLLVEGTPDKSIDRKLYTLIFPEYNIIPLESCNSVIQYTKAYKKVKDIHYVEVKGIIDRDRRSSDDILAYNSDSIFVPEVAEVESLLMLPAVIEVVCQKQSREDYISIIGSVKDKTFEFLNSQKEAQALLFAKQKSQNTIIKIINEKVNSLEAYKGNIYNIEERINIDEIYMQCIQEINDIIDRRDFIEALKVINNKGLIPYVQLPNHFGWKKDYYINYVLRLLNIGDKTSTSLKTVFKNYINIDI